MKKAPLTHARPRPTAEAARNPHVRPDARTRHAVGNAAQQDRARPHDADQEGGDWMAERIVPPPRAHPTEDTP